MTLTPDSQLDPAEPPRRRLLLTIGHSNHELPAFLELLKRHGVTSLADVRSHPYSRMYPQFNRETLRPHVENEGIRYVDLGPELGARRVEAECYVDGKVRFDRVRKLPLFRAGLERVRRGVERFRLALLCAEKDPVTCHRMILVCRELRGDAMEMAHIAQDGSLEPQADAERRLLELHDLPPGDLFRSLDEALDEAYERQAERIGFAQREAGEEAIG